jgi:hypothetical protein
VYGFEIRLSTTTVAQDADGKGIAQETPPLDVPDGENLRIERVGADARATQADGGRVGEDARAQVIAYETGGKTVRHRLRDLRGWRFYTVDGDRGPLQFIGPGVRDGLLLDPGART